MSDSPEPFAHLPQSEAVRVVSTSDRLATEFNLSDYQWRNRIVLVFAPSEQSPAYQQQLQQWKTHSDGIRDRDLKLIEVLGTGESRADGNLITQSSAERLRKQFGVAPKDFAVILVGKDGTEKQREQSPVAPTMLFRVIDAMPMRKQEMRSQQ